MAQVLSSCPNHETVLIVRLYGPHVVQEGAIYIIHELSRQQKSHSIKYQDSFPMLEAILSCVCKVCKK
jgi:hypothetical protein